jgi:hypothetical protein
MKQGLDISVEKDAKIYVFNKAILNHTNCQITGHQFQFFRFVPVLLKIGVKEDWNFLRF